MAAFQLPSNEDDKFCEAREGMGDTGLAGLTVIVPPASTGPALT